MSEYTVSSNTESKYCGRDSKALIWFNDEILDYCIYADEDSGLVHYLNPPDRRVRKAMGNVRIEWGVE